MNNLEQNESKGFPIGVGGWLLFFCVSLTIIGPLFSFGILMDSWETAKPAFAYIPSLKTITSFELLGSAVIVIYGFVIGCKIWAGNPEGKWLAKQYLKVRFFGFIGIETIVLLMMYLNKMPSSWMPGIIGGMIGRIIFGEGFFFLVWWFYFKKSKRVKNTYDRNTFIETHGNNVSNSEIDRQTSDRKESVSNTIHVADSIRSQQAKNVVSKSVMNDKAKINISRKSQKPLGTLVLGEAEIKRTVYSLLLKEKKDEATMLQAKVESDGDLEKAEIRYYQLRYDQIVESGKINEIEKRLLAAKSKKAEAQIEEAYRRADAEKRDWARRRILNDVVKDRSTGLTWFAGRDEDIDFECAKAWIEKLDIADIKWRMPTNKELSSLYHGSRVFEGVDTSKIIQIIGATPNRDSKCVWSGKTKGNSFAWYIDFRTAGNHSCDVKIAAGLRVIAVCSENQRELVSASAPNTIHVKVPYEDIGNNVVKDRSTDLEWLAGPDEDTTWAKAKAWIEKLKVGDSRWSMPEIADLKGLSINIRGFEGRKDVTGFISIIRGVPKKGMLSHDSAKCVWSVKKKGNTKACYFDFKNNEVHDCHIEGSGDLRALAVRSPIVG